MSLPRLVLNRSFMQDFAAAEPPCFALGFVEADGKRTGCLALRPDEEIPGEVLALGARFGHRLYGRGKAVLCQFIFEFYGLARYSALVNPANPLVRQVLETMIAAGDYHFFCVNPNGAATAFRSGLGERDLAGLLTNLPRMQAASTSSQDYEDYLCTFRGNPDPDGTLLNWVCRDNPDYLNLSGDAMALSPARQL